MKTLTHESRVALAKKVLPVVQRTYPTASLSLDGADPQIIIGEHSMTFTDVGPRNAGPSGKKEAPVRAFLTTTALRVVPALV